MSGKSEERTFFALFSCKTWQLKVKMTHELQTPKCLIVGCSHYSDPACSRFTKHNFGLTHNNPENADAKRPWRSFIWATTLESLDQVREMFRVRWHLWVEELEHRHHNWPGVDACRGTSSCEGRKVPGKSKPRQCCDLTLTHGVR